MLNYICETIFWCLSIYGLVSLIESIYNGITYNKIKKNIKMVLFVKDVEDGIENYIRELNYAHNFYNNLVIIDLDSKDNTLNILKSLGHDSANVRVFSKNESEEYLSDIYIEE